MKVQPFQAVGFKLAQLAPPYNKIRALKMENDPEVMRILSEMEASTVALEDMKKAGRGWGWGWGAANEKSLSNECWPHPSPCVAGGPKQFLVFHLGARIIGE